MQVSYQLLSKAERKVLPAEVADLPFGALRTNHIFVMDYYDDAWHDMRIVPYAPFSLNPGALVFHYGQSIFEGAKAFLHPDGELKVFRFDKNAERLNHSAKILCMPKILIEVQMQALMHLLDVEREWCPSEPESAMYIRPFMFATQDMLGVRPSTTYTFCIMLSPVGPYYPGGFTKALTLLITEKYHRAVSGGTGTAKACGNYAASLRPAEYAKANGAAQVLYLDTENKYLDEVGTMNHYHVLKDGTFIIPEFTDSILRSITSQSVLELASMGKIKARQERILLRDFLTGLRAGDIVEAGGFGTAAVVSPVGMYLLENGDKVKVGIGEVGNFTKELYALYNGMQVGKIEVPKGWLTTVPRYSESY